MKRETQRSNRIERDAQIMCRRTTTISLFKREKRFRRRSKAEEAHRLIAYLKSPRVSWRGEEESGLEGGDFRVSGRIMKSPARVPVRIAETGGTILSRYREEEAATRKSERVKRRERADRSNDGEEAKGAAR